MTTARDLLGAAAHRLRLAGVGSPDVDAELMLAHVLGTQRSRLMALGDVPDSAVIAFELALTRRERREPLQHIVGETAFRHIVVAVGDGVFVPRPETELLVDAVLPVLAAAADPVAVDLCAGSGALGIAIANEVPGARVWAVENSPMALSWLRRNCAGTGVIVVEGDVRDETVLAELAGSVAAVVSNPPYVPAHVDVEPEVRADPAAAVFGGPDGLAVVPHVIDCAARLLRTGGVLALEHDDSHEAAVPQLLHADGRWAAISSRSDLAGRPRLAVALRR